MGSVDQRQSRKPTLALLLLSPAIGELLSGSSPPEEFFNPLTFLLLVALYGAGALLAREAWVRWGDGPTSLLLLGAAYGVLEEGVVTRSFFCPTWPDLDVLAEHGRWLGVNWVWTVELTIFHSVFSVAIPVALVEFFYPQAGGRPWLGRRGVALSLASLAGVTLLGLIGFKCEVPVPTTLPALALLSAVLLAGLAKRIAGPYTPGPVEPPRAVRIYLLGASWAALTILGPYALAHAGAPAALTFAIELALAWLFVRWVLRRRWDSGLRAFDAASSPLWGMIVVAFLQGFSVPSMTLVGLGFALLLTLMRRRVRRLWEGPGAGTRPGSPDHLVEGEDLRCLRLSAVREGRPWRGSNRQGEHCDLSSPSS